MHRAEDMVARERRGAKSPLAKRLDWWLIGVFACTALMVLLAVTTLLHCPVPWWIYAPIFSFCLVMPLWAAWRYRNVWWR